MGEKLIATTTNTTKKSENGYINMNFYQGEWNPGLLGGGPLLVSFHNHNLLKEQICECERCSVFQ